MTCVQCHDLGWVLDGDASKAPLALELLACPIPGCGASGRPIAVLSLNEATFGKVSRAPLAGFVMSVSQ